jgi:uncharacterized protein
MKQPMIIDTGALVAYLNEKDTFHQWAKKQFMNAEYPLFTCEAVISETWFLLNKRTSNPFVIMQMLKEGIFTIPLHLITEKNTLAKLMDKYRNVPMSIADASLVRLSEYYPNCKVLTLDKDFTIYRRNKNQPIPVIMPNIQ